MNDKKNKLKKETYYKIFEQVSRRIRVSVDFGAKMAVYTVPGFIIGSPMFDRYKAAMYIRRQLEHRGFDVELSGEYELRITWKLHKNTTKTIPSTESKLPPGDDFPSLINLKKVANKMRLNAGKR